MRVEGNQVMRRKPPLGTRAAHGDLRIGKAGRSQREMDQAASSDFQLWRSVRAIAGERE